MNTTNELSRSIRMALDDQSISVLDRPRILQLAAAYAVGTSLPLAPSVEGDVRQFAQQVHFEEISRSLSKLNEIMVFDVQQACDLVLAFVAMRYKVFYGTPDLEDVNPNGCFLARFSGASQWLPQDTLHTYETHQRIVAALTNFIRSLLSL